jgi:predicted  nucleic acid-binding Zn ribbon protein
MSAFDLDFFPRPETRGDEMGQFDWLLDVFLCCLRGNGNIIGDWFPLNLRDRVQVRVMTPERCSLEERFFSIYAADDFTKLRALCCQAPHFRLIEEVGDEESCCTCENPSSYVLFTTYLDRSLPVDCGDCGYPVPLYRLPYLGDEKEHFRLRSWQSQYAALDALYMASFVGERLAYHQLHNPRSAFNRWTRQVAKELEGKSHKPVFVFILHAYQDFGDECPLCKRHWRLAEKRGIFAFKCEHCHLLSSEASSEAQPLTELHP